MKKAVLLLSVLILFAWACKKDNDEPEPTPTPTPYQYTSSDIGGAGDEFKIAVYTVVPADTFEIGGTGQTLVWVYNPIPTTTQFDTSTFGLPANHPDGAFFTGSNLYIDNHDDTYMFLNKQTDKVEVTGIWVFTNGDTIKGNLSDRYTVMKFPITYGSSFNDTGYVSVESTVNIGGTDYNAKYEFTFKINSTCNAEGNITTPLGSFKCIREKRVEMTYYKGSVQMLPPIWTEVFNDGDTTYTYSFWSKDKKWNVAELDVDITDKILTIGYLIQ